MRNIKAVHGVHFKTNDKENYALACHQFEVQ